MGLASLAEFLQLLDENIDRALRDPALSVDSASMDSNITQRLACTAREVGFEFGPPNVVLLRAGVEFIRAFAEASHGIAQHIGARPIAASAIPPATGTCCAMPPRGRAGASR